MQVAIHRENGTRHIHGPEVDPDKGAFKTLCGVYENAMSLEDDNWLDDFPEDFGHLEGDCQRCAEIFEDGQTRKEWLKEQYPNP